MKLLRASTILVALAVVAIAGAGCTGSTSPTATEGSQPVIESEPVVPESTEAEPAEAEPAEAASSTSTTEGSATDSAPASTTLPPAVVEAYGGLAAIDISPTGERLPSDSSMMAAALADAERAVRDPGLDPEALSRWGRWQQRLYHHLAANRDLVEPTLAAVGDTAEDPLAQAVALNWEARENLIKLLGTETTHSTVPAWRISAPPPADELLGYYREAEAETGIAWEYVAAINLVETRMGRIQGVSTAGAVGPMQFLPSTWAECCEGDPTKPRDAIVGAATYLTVRGGPDNMAKAIWDYNNSDYYVNAVTAYAEVMMADERAYHGYHGWQIYFLTTEGVVYLAEGYDQPEERPVTEWLGDNPDTLVTS